MGSRWNFISKPMILSVLVVAGAAVPAAAQTAPSRPAAAKATPAPVTFSKDIAPILQRSCQR